MAIISLQDASLYYGEHLILDSQNFTVELGEKVAIVGRNGQGKSTLLRVLNRETSLDAGKVIYQEGLIVSFLQQAPPREIKGKVKDYIASGDSHLWSLIQEYQTLHQDPSANEARYQTLIEDITSLHGWDLEDRALNLSTQYGFDPDQPASELSGGWLRKLELAKALVTNPDVLLLDEPTNHLDLASIENLEAFIKQIPITVIFVSHDRRFIDNVADEIIDLDRGKLVRFPGNFSKYSQLKAEALEIEEQQHQLFLKKLDQEEIWIRKGVKARTTRSQFRVKCLKEMREELVNYRKAQGTVSVKHLQELRSSKLIFNIKNISHQYKDEDPLIKDFNSLILAGNKIAIIGPNGVGKTTFIKLLLNEINPTKGEIKTAPNLEIAYFDQHRLELDPEKTMIDNLADGKQELLINGVQRHAIGYLQDFMFTAFKARSLVKTLSGGEKNRLLLAKILSKPSNLLILDEPTNDLDIETLDLLEDIIMEYKGTVLIISHDRQFMDNCVTECLFFEGNGHISSYIGGYTDALAQQKNSKSFQEKSNRAQEVPASQKDDYKSKQQVNRSQQKKKKLSYKEERRRTEIPGIIEATEAQLSSLQAELLKPNFWSQSQDIVKDTNNKIKELEDQISLMLQEWEMLETKAEN